MNPNLEDRRDVSASSCDYDGVVEYTCGYCNRPVAGHVIARHRVVFIQWLICMNCKHGSVVDEWGLYPQPLVGDDVIGLPETIATVYDEARKSFSSRSYTACELVCRKILMNVAVDKKAEEGKKFAFYIDHLESEGYITPPMKGWVGLIREHGNQSNHEIESPNPERAESTLSFTAQLLKLVYETEYNSNKFTKEKS